jgi:hypothetical protein
MLFGHPKPSSQATFNVLELAVNIALLLPEPLTGLLSDVAIAVTHCSNFAGATNSTLGLNNVKVIVSLTQVSPRLSVTCIYNVFEGSLCSSVLK